MQKRTNIKYQEGHKESKIILPARRNIVEMVLLFLMTFFMSPIMGPFLISEVFRTNGELMIIFFAILVPITGVVSLYSLAWQLAGKEIITIKADSLSVKKRIGGIGWRNELVIRPVEIETLDLSGLEILKVGSRIMFWGMPWHKALRIKSNGKWKYFGNDLSVEEAQEVISYIRKNMKKFECQPTPFAADSGFAASGTRREPAG